MNELVFDTLYAIRVCLDCLEIRMPTFSLEPVSFPAPCLLVSDLTPPPQKAAAVAGEAPQRRQEFDRDRDLGTSRFDDAQRAAAIKRSRGAADMFSSGAQKFL